MNAWLTYEELEPGDLFVTDERTGTLGEVLSKGDVGGTPRVIWLTFKELADGRKFEGCFNAKFITKYLRPGERDPRLQDGRGWT